MRRFPPFPFLLALVWTLALSPAAHAGEYVVRAGTNAVARDSAGMTRLVTFFRPLGLIPRRELRNLPGTLVAEMPAETARLLALQGYDVQLLPTLHLAADGAPWPLDRANQRTLPLDGNAARPYTGRGVRIFVLDSSLFPNLDEFGTRIAGGTDYLEDGLGVFNTCGADHTHATIVASAAAGKVYGVAPEASLFLMRISDCGGNIYGFAELAALDDILTWRQANPTVPAVVNMSYAGFGANPAEEALFQKLDALGVLLVDAAGNNGDDACRYSPASSPETVTVGISDIADQRAPRSGYGRCVDLFAPGKDVTTQGGNQPIVASGSSLSAPFVAGTLALLLEQLPDLPPSQVRQLLLTNATKGIVGGDLGAGSPNLLLYDGPLHEDVSRFISRWFPGEHRFTTQIGVTLNGTPTPFPQVHLYRGPSKDGHCQGVPFATVELQADGSAVSNIVGWKQAPAFLCVETQRKTVFDRFVRILG
ncbi:MAG: serine protease [Acidobacteriota bacterium]|jgi:subtilisin family serine protease|nr:serine protease [Acidobacteriota bacterium]